MIACLVFCVTRLVRVITRNVKLHTVQISQEAVFPSSISETWVTIGGHSVDISCSCRGPVANQSEKIFFCDVVYMKSFINVCNSNLILCLMPV